MPGASESATFDLSVVIPDATGQLNQVTYQGLTVHSTPSFVNLPGAPGGCRDGFAVLRPALEHALSLLAGEPTAHKQT